MRGCCVRCKRITTLAFQNRHGLRLCQACLDKQLNPLRDRQKGVIRPWPRMILTLEGTPIWLTGDVQPGMPITIDGHHYVVAMPEGGVACTTC